MKRTITASIQARMGSSRLPGKVLKEICGQPMLLRQIDRIKKSRLIDQVVVATTTSKKDDLIEEFCRLNNLKFFRGSENDVLSRICDLLKEYNVDIHVEFCGDSPLPDPQIIDEIIGCFLKFNKEAEYFSSALKTTYPPGTEVTVYSSKILLKVNELVDIDDPLREHVGYNITRFKNQFKQFSIEAPPCFYQPEIYLEVDTPKDFEFIDTIYNYFLKKNKPDFSLMEILNFLRENPTLRDSNKNEVRRWKELRGK